MTILEKILDNRPKSSAPTISSQKILKVTVIQSAIGLHMRSGSLSILYKYLKM